jgi:hypothetical protein
MQLNNVESVRAHLLLCAENEKPIFATCNCVEQSSSRVDIRLSDQELSLSYGSPDFIVVSASGPCLEKN